ALPPRTVHGERQAGPDALRPADAEGDGLALYLDHLLLNLGKALAHLTHEGGERDRRRGEDLGCFLRRLALSPGQRGQEEERAESRERAEPHRRIDPRPVPAWIRSPDPR